MKQSPATHQIHSVQHLVKNYQILKKQENDSQPGFKNQSLEIDKEIRNDGISRQGHQNSY